MTVVSFIALICSAIFISEAEKNKHCPAIYRFYIGSHRMVLYHKNSEYEIVIGAAGGFSIMKTHRLCVLLNRGEAGIQDRTKSDKRSISAIHFYSFML